MNKKNVKTNKWSYKRSRNNKRLNKINTLQKRFVWDKQTDSKSEKRRCERWWFNIFFLLISCLNLNLHSKREMMSNECSSSYRFKICVVYSNNFQVDYYAIYHLSWAFYCWNEFLTESSSFIFPRFAFVNVLLDIMIWSADYFALEWATKTSFVSEHFSFFNSFFSRMF